MCTVLGFEARTCHLECYFPDKYRLQQPPEPPRTQRHTHCIIQGFDVQFKAENHSLAVSITDKKYSFEINLPFNVHLAREREERPPDGQFFDHSDACSGLICLKRHILRLYWSYLRILLCLVPSVRHLATHGYFGSESATGSKVASIDIYENKGKV